MRRDDEGRGVGLWRGRERWEVAGGTFLGVGEEGGLSRD